MVADISRRVTASGSGEVAAYGSGAFAVGGCVVALALIRSSYAFVVLGLVVALTGLFLLHLAMRGFCTGPKQQASMAGLGASGYITGAALIAIAADLGVGILALVGTWVAAPSLAAIAAVMRVRCIGSSEHQGRPGLCASFGVVTAALSLLAAVLLNVDWVVVVALLVGILGLALGSIGLLGLTKNGPLGWTIVGFLVVLGGVVGLALWVGYAGDPLVLIPIVFIIGLGFVPISKGLPELLRNRTRVEYPTVFAVGLAFAAVLTVTFSRAEWPTSWTIGVVLLAGLISVALVADVVELATLLLLGVALTAIVTNRGEAVLDTPHADAPIRIVALGDSYMSGEGSNTFLPGTNIAGENECRRSSTAYAYLVADSLGMDLDFFACSGARTKHVAMDGQQPNSPAGVAGPLPQLANLVDEDKQIAAVIVSIGGNDAWFGTVGQACVAPGSCDVHRETILRNVSAIGNALKGVYTAIVDRVGRDIPIVAMPYPLTATESGCEASPLTQTEHAFLFEFTEVLNERARTEAARVGINWFGPGVAAFDGYQICEVAGADSAMNVIHVNAPEGDLVDRIKPTNWIHGSAHPNMLGHELTAAALEPWLRQLFQNVVDGAPANPEPNPRAEFELPMLERFQRVSTRPLGIPADLLCPAADMPISALSASAPLGGRRNFVGLMPGSAVCVSTPDGGWKDDTVANDEGVAAVDLWSQDLAEGHDEETGGASQILISQANTGLWRVAVINYCELDPGCAADAAAIEAWMYGRVTETARSTVVPAFFVFLGAWFVAMEGRRFLTGNNASKRRAAVDR